MDQRGHFCIYGPKKRCSIGLYAGDVSKNTCGQVADLLIASAFKGDYSPTPKSVIGALSAAGVVLRTLRDEAEFLNPDCWLTPVLPSWQAEAIGAKRILCYEGGHANPVNSLQMMFSALINATISHKVHISKLTMPILCSGDQEADPHRMLQQIVDSTIKSFEAGLSAEDVRIVALPNRVSEYAKTFEIAKHNYDPFSTAQDPPIAHDMFISYSWGDNILVEKVHDDLQAKFGKSLRVFRDVAGGLKPGDVIPVELSNAIRASRCMTAFYSGKYVDSPACNMEFSLAYLRKRQMPGDFQFRSILVGDEKDITGDFRDIMWNDTAGKVELACSHAETIARSLIEKGSVTGLVDQVARPRRKPQYAR